MKYAKRPKKNGKNGAPLPRPAVVGDNAVSRRRVEYDPDLDEALKAIEGMKPSEVSLASGGLIGAGTVYNWRRGKVRTPLNYTIRAAYRAAGLELVARKIK